MYQCQRNCPWVTVGGDNCGVAKRVWWGGVSFSYMFPFPKSLTARFQKVVDNRGTNIQLKSGLCVNDLNPPSASAKRSFTITSLHLRMRSKTLKFGYTGIRLGSEVGREGCQVEEYHHGRCDERCQQFTLKVKRFDVESCKWQAGAKFRFMRCLIDQILQNGK